MVKACFAEAKGGIVRGLEAIDLNLHVNADEHLIKQACTNLISNAAKFCETSQVVVHVTFERSESEDHDGVLEVVVTDGGKGMTPAQLETVLVPFAQIRTGEDRVKGTGLGLSLTKEMVESYVESLLLLACLIACVRPSDLLSSVPSLLQWTRGREIDADVARAGQGHDGDDPHSAGVGGRSSNLQCCSRNGRRPLGVCSVQPRRRGRRSDCRRRPN